jgi:Transcriptional regulator, AbiEi antitoxin, Type IV TA system
MKTSGTLKERDFEARFEVLLRELLGRAPFLKLVSLKKDAKISPRSPDRADRLAQVAAGDRKWTLVVEEKRLGQPREVRTAALQLERYLKHLPADVPHYGVLLAPFISAESAQICAEAGIGYADLAGNARLSFDQVFIETRSPENPFREKRETRSLFAPRATRVLRVLLQGPLRAWKVTALAESTRVSLGWVSAVRQQLLAREWAAEEPGGLRMTKPGAVLEAWAKADDWEKRTRTHEYSVLINEPLELAEKLKEALADEPPVFTQWFAGWLRHPYTTPVVVTAYVKEFPDEALIKEKLLGRRVTGGGERLRLVWPKDEGVLHPQQTVQGFQLVSDVQIYLDLQRAGLRAEEQAEELKRWPDFAGGWV